jgi:hypothetical protein
MFAEIAKLFDSYNRIARVYPALLTLSPIAWYVIAFGNDFGSNVGKGVLGLLICSAALFLFSSVARFRGRAVEARLIAKWGGWPTTSLLRHRDKSIDPTTKSRYHAELSKICKTPLPDPSKESASPDECDGIYRSATKALIESRRGSEYKMVHDENASYGFRRNLYGMRPIAILVWSVVAALTIGTWWLLCEGIVSGTVAIEIFRRDLAWIAVTVLNIIYISMFSILVTENFVRQSAIAYAEALLRTLEPRPRQRTKTAEPS